MTHRQDVAQRHDVVARWCALAEQRLEHLTEMFESGRWRRYHSELEFLENIREAKAAVDMWRSLAKPHAKKDASAVSHSLSSPATGATTEQSSSIVPQQSPPARQDNAASREEALAVSAIDMLAVERVLASGAPSLNVSPIEQRYPLLRNTL